MEGGRGGGGRGGGEWKGEGGRGGECAGWWRDYVIGSEKAYRVARL